MKKFSTSAAMTLVGATYASVAAADNILVTNAPPPAPPPAACSGFVDFITTSCPLSWYGVTVYGAVDARVSWQSHGTPFNPSYNPGTEPFVSANGNRALWNIAPNGLRCQRQSIARL